MYGECSCELNIVDSMGNIEQTVGCTEASVARAPSRICTSSNGPEIEEANRFSRHKTATDTVHFDCFVNKIVHSTLAPMLFAISHCGDLHASINRARAIV